MKAKTLLTIATMSLIVNAMSQNPYLVLTFTAVDSYINIPVDSIKIMNRSQECDTMLYWPDTVLLLGTQVGISENKDICDGLKVYQNFPNPFDNQTNITIYVPDRDEVVILLTDIIGRVIIKTEKVLNKGLHTVKCVPGRGNMYLFTAQWRGNVSSIKILQYSGEDNGTKSLEYQGSQNTYPHHKAYIQRQDFTFSFGDTLLYIAYYDTLESGILELPESNATHTFQFAFNIPCLGTPTVTYEGQTYNTVQVFSQCWLKENLNVGMMIQSSEDMTDNDIIEKYCYDNDPTNCDIYGGLYQWWEMMQYSIQQGLQGICPPGWHIPRDEELKILDGAVDSHFGIGDPEWDKTFAFRGFDAHENLKSSTGWFFNNGEDCSGVDRYRFSSQPGGRKSEGSFFYSLGRYGSNMTYDHHGHPYSHSINCNYPGVGRSPSSGTIQAFSVRCIKD